MRKIILVIGIIFCAAVCSGQSFDEDSAGHQDRSLNKYDFKFDLDSVTLFQWKYLNFSIDSLYEDNLVMGVGKYQDDSVWYDIIITDSSGNNPCYKKHDSSLVITDSLRTIQILIWAIEKNWEFQQGQQDRTERFGKLNDENENKPIREKK